MDQFRQVLPGETLPGFPGRAWNKMLEGLSQNASGPFAGSDADGPIEISVKNTTGAALGRFAILGIATPTITKANDANQFYVRDLMDGIAPTATSTIVITQTTLDVNEIGKARVMGLARVQVDITDETHTHAVPTTSTTQLTSGASGPAKILHKESAGTGVKWCVVALTNNAAAGSGLSLTDGTTTVTGVTALTLSPDAAWTISGTTPNATATLFYAGGGDGTLGVNSDESGIVGGDHYTANALFSNGYLSSSAAGYYGTPIQKMGTGCKLFDYIGVGPVADTVYTYCMRPSSIMVEGNKYYGNLYGDHRTALKIMSMTDAASGPALSGYGRGLQGFGAVQTGKVFMYGDDQVGGLANSAISESTGVVIEDSTFNNLTASGFFPSAGTSTNWNVLGVFGWATNYPVHDMVQSPYFPGMVCFTYSGYGTAGGPPPSSNFKTAFPTNLSTLASLLWVPGRVVANSGYSAQEDAAGVVTMYDGTSAIRSGLKFVGGLYISGALAVNLATDVTGTLAVSNGGTGAATFTAGQLIAANGTSALDSLTSTRISGEELELRLGADQWIGFTSGSF